MFGFGKKKDSAEAAVPVLSMAEMQPAGFWLRVVALVVDSALMVILAGAMLMGAASVGGEEMVPVAYWAWIVVSFLYWPVLESTPRRATVGKMLLGLVVADVDGGKLSFGRSLLRNLAKVISAIPLYIGFLLAAFTARKQALHDLITKAVVLRTGASSFLRAVGVLAVGVALFVAGGYLAADYLTGAVMKDLQAVMSGGATMPAKPPAVSKPAAKPAPAPVVKPAPAPVAKPEAPAPVAAVKPEAAPAPQAPAAAPDPAPVAKSDPAPAPAPAAKPAAPPAPAPKPAPEKPAAAAKAPAMAEESKPVPPAPVSSTRPPAGPSPKFNDIMTAVLYSDRDAVAQLLDFGRWPDKRDSNGLTPLMVAIINGDSPMVRMLLERGADPALQAPGGLTALDYARQGGDSDLTQLVQRSSR